MSTQIDINRATKVGEILVNTYEKSGIFGHGKGEMPELLKPRRLKKGSFQHVNYVTLLVSLDYMRNANQLWQAGYDTFNDEEVQWVFDVNSKKMRNFNILIKALQKNKISKHCCPN